MVLPYRATGLQDNCLNYKMLLKGNLDMNIDFLF